MAVNVASICSGVPTDWLLWLFSWREKAVYYPSKLHRMCNLRHMNVLYYLNTSNSTSYTNEDRQPLFYPFNHCVFTTLYTTYKIKYTRLWEQNVVIWNKFISAALYISWRLCLECHILLTTHIYLLEKCSIRLAYQIYYQVVVIASHIIL